MRGFKAIQCMVMLTLAFLLAGCATVQMAPDSADLEAKRFEKSEEMSRIYLYRGWFATAIVFHLTLDGELIGNIAPNTYHMIEVEPGHHLISVSSNENIDYIEIDTAKGENLYVKVSAAMGMMSARAQLTIESEAMAKSAISGYKRAQSMLQ